MMKLISFINNYSVLKKTNRQALNHRKDFLKNPSVDIRLSKTQLSKMIQLGEFPGRFPCPFLILKLTGFPYIH